MEGGGQRFLMADSRADATAAFAAGYWLTVLAARQHVSSRVAAQRAAHAEARPPVPDRTVFFALFGEMEGERPREP